MSQEIDDKIDRVTKKLERFRGKHQIMLDKIHEREQRLKLDQIRAKADEWADRVSKEEHKLLRLIEKKAKNSQ